MQKSSVMTFVDSFCVFVSWLNKEEIAKKWLYTLEVNLYSHAFCLLIPAQKMSKLFHLNSWDNKQSNHLSILHFSILYADKKYAGYPEIFQISMFYFDLYHRCIYSNELVICTKIFWSRSYIKFIKKLDPPKQRVEWCFQELG